MTEPSTAKTAASDTAKSAETPKEEKEADEDDNEEEKAGEGNAEGEAATGEKKKKKKKKSKRKKKDKSIAILPESSFNISAANFVPSGFTLPDNVAVTSTDSTKPNDTKQTTSTDQATGSA